jgi:hypothetical protein
MGWVVSTTPRPLYSRERPGTYCAGGWVGPRAGLHVCEKSRPHRDSIPGPSSPYPVAIPTELSRLTVVWNVDFYLRSWQTGRQPGQLKTVTDRKGKLYVNTCVLSPRFFYMFPRSRNMKNTVFRDVPPCSLIENYLYFIWSLCFNRKERFRQIHPEDGGLRIQHVEFSVDPADSTIRVDKDRSTPVIRTAWFPETAAYFHLYVLTLLFPLFVLQTSYCDVI